MLGEALAQRLRPERLQPSAQLVPPFQQGVDRLGRVPGLRSASPAARSSSSAARAAASQSPASRSAVTAASRSASAGAWSGRCGSTGSVILRRTVSRAARASCSAARTAATRSASSPERAAKPSRMRRACSRCSRRAVSAAVSRSSGPVSTGPPGPPVATGSGTSRRNAADVLRGHEGAVLDVEFSPDGRRVLSSGTDRSVRLWNLSDGSSQVLRGHQGRHTPASAPTGPGSSRPRTTVPASGTRHRAPSSSRSRHPTARPTARCSRPTDSASHSRRSMPGSSSCRARSAGQIRACSRWPGRGSLAISHLPSATPSTCRQDHEPGAATSSRTIGVDGEHTERETAHGVEGK